MQLDRCGKQNANSHDDAKSKYLKYNQIVAISDALTIAPHLSAAQLRRNMQLADSPSEKIAPELLRSVQHWVKLSRAQLTMKQLDGFDINSSYGSVHLPGRCLFYVLMFISLTARAFRYPGVKLFACVVLPVT